MAQQTAVEWLFLMLNNPNRDQEFAHKLFQKAKEMEKEQITDAYNMGSYDMAEKKYEPEQYYNKKYGTE